MQSREGRKEVVKKAYTHELSINKENEVFKRAYKQHSRTSDNKPECGNRKYSHTHELSLNKEHYEDNEMNRVFIFT